MLTQAQIKKAQEVRFRRPKTIHVSVDDKQLCPAISDDVIDVQAAQYVLKFEIGAMLATFVNKLCSTCAGELHQRHKNNRLTPLAMHDCWWPL